MSVNFSTLIPFHFDPKFKTQNSDFGLFQHDIRCMIGFVIKENSGQHAQPL